MPLSQPRNTGKETYNEVNATNDRSFTGQDQNVVQGSLGTGVYDYLFRKYDPSAGRWLSPDPAGWAAVNATDPQSLDRYAYVENQPLQDVDLMGLCEVTQNNIYDDQGNLVSAGDPSYREDGGLPCIYLTGPSQSGCVLFGECQAPDPGNPGQPSQGGNPTGGTPWYKNSCVTSALGAGALSAGVDAIGLIPEAGGIARMIGHGSGYVGVVADRAGYSVVNAVGKSASTVQGLNGLFDTSPQGLISDGLTVAGFIPGLGQAAAIGSIIMDTYKTAKAISQCP